MFTEIPDEDWAPIQPCLTHRIVQKNRVLMKPGEICTHLYFLEMGSIRYFINEGKEVSTVHTNHPPGIISSHESFIQQTPSLFGIQSIEESYVWIITRVDFYRLMEIQSWKDFISKI